jgi:1,4-dihydroxy-2-naphthoate octaprenyltransferase
LLSLSGLLIIIVALLTSWWALLGLGGFVLLIPAVRIVLSGGSGAALIAVLKATSLAELASAIAFSFGLTLATFR